jgi:PAS domain S-box-containing protein
MTSIDQTPLRILLIEDNAADAYLLRELLAELESQTWQIIHAECLRDGVNHLVADRVTKSGDRPFDVVLSDLSLPDAQGLETVEQLYGAAAGIPIIVLTSLNNEAIGLEAIRRGAQDYLVKGGVEGSLLMRSIRYAIERSHIQHVMRQQAAAMAACREGIAILNLAQEFTYVNQAYAEIHGYPSPADLLGKSWRVVLDATEYEDLSQKAQTLLQNQGYWNGIAVCRQADEAHVLHTELFLTAFENGLICTVRDISDRIQAEAEIRKALEQERELSELKSNFVSMVSHEFRTPLTVILSSVQMLQNYSDQLTDEKKQLRLDHIINGARRMTELLEEVLIVGNAQSGALKCQPEPIDLDEFCHELLDEQRTCSMTVPDLIFINHAHLHKLHLDRRLLHRILSNLISNAIKYSPQQSPIRVEVRSVSEGVQFGIQDYGIGISLVDQEKLFTPFYRGHNVKNIPGTGLGLSIVKQCVDLHQGSIEVVSQINQGTLFIVTLPLSVSESSEVRGCRSGL